jgi:hypothetical protein
MSTCSKCGWKLRRNNTTGICSNAKACRSREAGAEDDVLDRTSLQPPPKKSDALRRFRTVAEALGQDPDKLLADWCEGWLGRLKTNVEGA